MSFLNNKLILFINEISSKKSSLKEVLQQNGAQTKTLSYTNLTSQADSIPQADLIIVSRTADSADFKEMITFLRQLKKQQFVPLFILTDDTRLSIESILNYGATDHISAQENPELIIDKIERALGVESVFSGSSSIDITPPEASTTTTGIRVYVVEDDSLLRNLLSTRLERSSFPHEFSPTAEGAVDAMKQFLPQVIILDLMLPGKDGFELLADIKNDSDLKNIPVIVFSNRDGQNDRKRALELGAVAFRVKAMTDLAELVETIEELAI